MDKKWENAKAVIEKIEQSGHAAYLVGGCIRDQFLNLPVMDIDIATSALPETIISLFNHVIPIGIQHGTVLVLHKGDSFEITTFRSEGNYSDKRHPDKVTFIPDVNGDLARRDFTINALAMDKHGALIDLFGGQEDLKKRQIKTVGDANARFTEDALRILRALRFSSQLGFSIDSSTLKQMILLKYEIKHVAVERIKDECQKFFQGKYVSHGLQLLKQTDIAMVLPIFSDYPQLIEDTPDNLTAFTSFAEVIAFYHFKKPQLSIQSWAKAWKCSNNEKKRSLTLAKGLFYYAENGVNYWLAYILNNEEIREAFIHLHAIIFPSHPAIEQILTEKLSSLPITSRMEMKINGNEIISLFPLKNKGSWISRLLMEIEYNVVTGTLKNDNTLIKEWITCHPPGKN